MVNQKDLTIAVFLFLVRPTPLPLFLLTAWFPALQVVQLLCYIWPIVEMPEDFGWPAL